MDFEVTPGFALQGELPPDGPLALPGDKSLSHRVALLAALAEGESRIENFLVAGVTRPLLDALRALGVRWELEGNRLRVQGVGLGGLSTPAEPPILDCGNSATTLRLLAGALAAWGCPAVLDGSPGLRRRPMRRIVEPLQQMGVAIESTDGCAPLRLSASRKALQGGEFTLPVASAQVKSCLLLAGLRAESPLTILEPGPSRDHTERLLRGLGVRVEAERRGDQYLTHLQTTPAGQLPAFDLTLPGDFSAAAFLIVAALVTPGSDLRLSNVGLNPTRTGLLEALLAMGGRIEVSGVVERQGEPVGGLRARYSRLRGVEIRGEQVVRMIDEFPVFAVGAAHAQGQTRVAEAAELRTKESDRIAALCGELRRLGVQVEEREDGFEVGRGTYPPAPSLKGRGEAGDLTPRGKGGEVEVEAQGDHRLAMALAVAGLAGEEAVRVHGAELAAESFPNFARVLQALGAQVEVRE